MACARVGAAVGVGALPRRMGFGGPWGRRALPKREPERALNHDREAEEMKCLCSYLVPCIRKGGGWRAEIRSTLACTPKPI